MGSSLMVETFAFYVFNRKGFLLQTEEQNFS